MGLLYLLTCICLTARLFQWNSAHCNTWRHRCGDCCVLCVSRDIDIGRNLGSRYLYTCTDAECGKGHGGEIRMNKTSIALTFHITRMADTNIKKKSRAEYMRQYRLKRKMEMQQQTSATSEHEIAENKRSIIFTSIDRRYWIMYMSYLRLIHGTR